MAAKVNIFWFRRDLRLTDNAGLYHALKAGIPLVPIFIFDRNILDDLEDPHDRRVEFIHAAIQEMQTALLAAGSSLEVYYGYPLEVLSGLLKKYSVAQVFTNNDYEPYAIRRDEAVQSMLREHGVVFNSYKDHVIFEKKEIVKEDGIAYSVFSPYSRKWLATLTDFHLKAYPVEKYDDHFYRQSPQPIISLEMMGFKKVDKPFPSRRLEEDLVIKYGEDRDYPGREGTSRMGVHLRFGTVSVREIARRSRQLSTVFLNELIWRDFYQMILWNFPWVGEGKSFRPAFDHIRWRNDEADFERWCKGETGYPIVDAGMRELNQTGFMHNRVRMIVASFLTKHLLIDWRWGEAYFGAKLLDYDFASNNGGWQWASGSGCDAVPYFRIFNPWLQTKKFDPAYVYIKKWVPEFKDPSYPRPMVDHEFARKRYLELFSSGSK